MDMLEKKYVALSFKSGMIVKCTKPMTIEEIKAECNNEKAIELLESDIEKYKSDIEEYINICFERYYESKLEDDNPKNYVTVHSNVNLAIFYDVKTATLMLNKYKELEALSEKEKNSNEYETVYKELVDLINSCYENHVLKEYVKINDCLILSEQVFDLCDSLNTIIHLESFVKKCDELGYTCSNFEVTPKLSSNVFLSVDDYHHPKYSYDFQKQLKKKRK